MTPLIGLTLSPNMVHCLDVCARKDWGVQAGSRTKATDVINISGNIITVNPNSPDTALIPVAGAADGKQALYAATDILLERHSTIAPGFHLEYFDTQVIRTVEAVLFEKRNGSWKCARRQNGEFVPIDFNQMTGDEAYTAHTRHASQNKHDWIDMIAAGGKVVIEAPEGLLNYYGSILAAEPEAAKAIIAEHEAKAIERDHTKHRSETVVETDIISSVVVDGATIPIEDLMNKWIQATNNGKTFSVRGNDRKWLTQLVKEGALFSF